MVACQAGMWNSDYNRVEMISRKNRFHGHNALPRVYGRAQTARGQLLAIKYVANARRTSYRAAVVVSKKVHKSAVVRARIRRRLYEILRTNSDHMTAPYDIVLIVFSEKIASMDGSLLRNQVIKQLKQAGILRKTDESMSHKDM